MTAAGAVGEQLDSEDAKLIVLARSARGRTGASQGAAVRDGDGRTYVAVTVALPHLGLSALQAAVASAVSSGAVSLVAAAIVSADGETDRVGLLAVRDLSASAVVFSAGSDGNLLSADRGSTA